MSFLGNLIVRLSADSADFVSKMQGAANAAEDFSERVAGSYSNVNSGAKNTTAQLNIFARQAGSSFKSVGRIAQGIIVSQAFYRTIGAIRSATTALGDFCSEVEQTGVSFDLLLKNQNKAKSFMNMVQDFAADTPYTFSQAADNARKLLAYGFDPSSLKTVMNGLADAASASGNSEAFSRVGLAIGEIKTKGFLASRQLLQLANAGIPAFDILKEKLKLTNDQLANIGKLKIPADTAIKAIMAGIKERYGGAAEAMSNTVSGMIATIKDNSLIIGQNAFDGLYQSFKSVITKIRDESDKLRAVVRESGLGGLIRYLIPADMVPKLQLFAANIRELRQSFVILFQAISPVAKAMGQELLLAINMVFPIFNGLFRILVVVAQMLTSNSKAVRILVGSLLGLLIAAQIARILMMFGAVIKSLFAVKILAQLLISLAHAFRVLAVAMMTNGWVALIAVAAGALLYFGLTSKKVSGWLTGIGSTITKAFDVDPSKIFVPKTKENTKASNDFNKSINNTTDKLEDTGDAAKKATKAAKDMLMTFDEVFTLKDPDENTPDVDNGIDTTGLDDVTPAIPPISIPQPVFPDVTDSVQNWIDKFKSIIITKLRNSLIGAGIGALIGGILGTAINPGAGTKLGVMIGAIAGAIVGAFWDDLGDRFHDAAKAAAIGTILGGAIGLIFFGPGGAAIGMVVGGAAAGIVTYFWSSLKKFFDKSTSIGTGVGTVIGGVIGTLICPGIGTAVGAALGAVIGALVTHFWKWLVDKFKSNISVGTVAGATVGGAIGSFFCPGIGTAVGAAIGIVVAGLVKTYWSDIKAKFLDSAGVGRITGTVVGGFIGSFFCPGFGTAIGAAIGFVIGGLVGKFWSDLKNKFTGSKAAGTLSGTVIGGIVGTMFCPGFGTVAGAAIGSVAGNLMSGWWDKLNEFFCGSKSRNKGSAIGKLVGGIVGAAFGNALGDAMGELIGGAMGRFWNFIADALNKAIAQVNNISVTVPNWVPGFAGDHWGFNLPKIPRLAGGGLITRNTYAELAEGNKKEAVLPLENNSAMSKIADAIISRMPQQPAQGAQQQDDRPIFYVGTLIASDQSLKELDRRMRIVKLQEDQRRG